MGPRNSSLLLGLVIGLVGLGLVPSGEAGASDISSDQECRTCHLPEPLFSHPVNVIPSIPIPDDFPLTDGRITCRTCHTGGDERIHSNALTGEQTSGTWREALTDVRFCAQCHLGNGTEVSMAHGTGIGRAHLRWSDALDEQTWQYADSRTAPLGSMTETQDACLSCHDGGMSGDGSSLTFPGGMRSERHPIGVPYAPFADRRATSKLVPISELDGRIRLFGGNVECGSCHSVYSPESSLLVMSNYGSGLCFACHDM